MAFPQWPITVPYRPLRKGFAVVRPANDGRRTDMADGSARQRATGVVQVRQYSIIWPMTQTEFAAFDTFLTDECSNGFAWFQMPFLTGTAFETRKVRLLGGKYTTAPIGVHIAVSTTVEVKP